MPPLIITLLVSLISYFSPSNPKCFHSWPFHSLSSHPSFFLSFPFSFLFTFLCCPLSSIPFPSLSLSHTHPAYTHMLLLSFCLSPFFDYPLSFCLHTYIIQLHLHFSFLFVFGSVFFCFLSVFSVTSTLSSMLPSLALSNPFPYSCSLSLSLFISSSSSLPLFVTSAVSKLPFIHSIFLFFLTFTSHGVVSLSSSLCLSELLCKHSAQDPKLD